jgi:hypothetical protein
MVTQKDERWRDLPLTVSRLDLSIDLDAAVSRNHVIGNWDTLVDRDSLVNNGVVLHAGKLSAVTHSLGLSKILRTWTC